MKHIRVSFTHISEPGVQWSNACEFNCRGDFDGAAIVEGSVTVDCPTCRTRVGWIAAALAAAVPTLCGKCPNCLLVDRDRVARVEEFLFNLDDDEAIGVDDAVAWCRDAYPTCDVPSTEVAGAS